jgi:hypothetical protein
VPSLSASYPYADWRRRCQRTQSTSRRPVVSSWYANARRVDIIDKQPTQPAQPARRTSGRSSSGQSTRSALTPSLSQEEHQFALRAASRYLSRVGLRDEPYDPDIADRDGLVSYINGTTNPPPAPLIQERTEVSAVLEGLTGIVTAAVLQTAGGDDAAKHQPDLWTDPIKYGLAPFISGFSTETVTYSRKVRGVEVATQFLNILMDAVTEDDGGLQKFKQFLAAQGDVIRLQGEDSQEGYKYACIGMVHEIFQLSDGTWIYLPKFRAYFTSFTRKTFTLSSACAKVDTYDFDFRVEKFVAPFKIQMWRDYDWFRQDVNSFIRDYTKAEIDKSRNYFNGIFKSTQ